MVFRESLFFNRLSITPKLIEGLNAYSGTYEVFFLTPEGNIGVTSFEGNDSGIYLGYFDSETSEFIDANRQDTPARD